MTVNLIEHPHVVALKDCLARFGEYARHHLAKDPPDVEKAERNQAMMEVCAVALAVPDLSNVARTLAAYALNAAHGAILADFEMTHLTELAAAMGAKTTDHHLKLRAARRIIGEITLERVKQIDIFGYTADRDDANPDKLYHEVLTRVEQRPNNVEQRSALIEAAAIIVAEIESLDRRFPK